MTENEKLDLVFNYYKNHSINNTTPTSEDTDKIALECCGCKQYDTPFRQILAHLLRQDNLLAIISGIPRSTPLGNKFEGYVTQELRERREKEEEIERTNKGNELHEKTNNRILELGTLIQTINNQNAKENSKSLLISVAACIFSGISLLIAVLASELQNLPKLITSIGVSLIVVIIILTLLKTNKSQ